jgi:hypothetical protein
MSVHDNFDLKGFLKSKKLLKENQEFDFTKDDSSPNKLSHKWNNLEDEMKWELLLTAIKDPKEAERFIEFKWDNLPPEIQSNIDWSVESAGQELDEVEFAKTAPDATKMKALLVKTAKFVQDWEAKDQESFNKFMDVDLAIELEKYL